MKEILESLIKEEKHWGIDSTGIINTIDEHIQRHIEMRNKLLKTNNIQSIVDEFIRIENLQNLRRIIEITKDIMNLEKFEPDTFELVKECYSQFKKENL